MKRQRILTGTMARSAAVVVLLLSLGGCSSVPDWANPVEWYKGTADWLGDESPEAVAAREAAAKPENAPPKADEPFPKLASVPSRPEGAADRAARRQKVEQALVADRANARHVALGGTDKGPALENDQAKAPPQAPAQAPAPAEVARVPVPVKPAPSVYPPAGSNPAFQAAIAQQNSAALASRGSQGPIRRNTIGVPPAPSSGVTLTPPGAKAKAEPAPAVRAPAFRAAGGEPLATVLFANNSARISDSYASTLRSVVEMQRKTGGTIKVIGHASSRTRNTNPLGHQIANFRISMARARAVADRLVRIGAPAGKIEVSGVSDSQPIYQEIMPLGEAGNRRAEIYLEN
jgi:outer membrane protein OmpA-like peptidoglycan-associated protein